MIIITEENSRWDARSDSGAKQGTRPVTRYADKK